MPPQNGTKLTERLNTIWACRTISSPIYVRQGLEKSSFTLLSIIIRWLSTITGIYNDWYLCIADVGLKPSLSQFVTFHILHKSMLLVRPRVWVLFFTTSINLKRLKWLALFEDAMVMVKQTFLFGVCWKVLILEVQGCQQMMQIHVWERWQFDSGMNLWKKMLGNYNSEVLCLTLNVSLWGRVIHLKYEINAHSR